LWETDARGGGAAGATLPNQAKKRHAEGRARARREGILFTTISTDRAGSVAPEAASIRFGTGRPGPHVIVLGNEKGGSGKSTTAMHLAVALLKSGYTVGTIDLDARQGTFSRYIDNRRSLVEDTGLPLPLPDHRRVFRSEAASRAEAEAEEEERLKGALAELGAHDFIVVDTPGSDSFLSRLGHTYADTLITPLNDSFLDIDLLARIDREARKVLAPSVYSQMVWEQRQRRALNRRPPIDWIVMRNRLGHIDARNKRDIARLLEQLSKRLGFRVAPGFGERVIFRELFHKGLTLLDLRAERTGAPFSVSHAAARQEVFALLESIGLPDRASAQQAYAHGPVESEKIAPDW
jgi:chromosome partitioning protein